VQKPECTAEPKHLDKGRKKEASGLRGTGLGRRASPENPNTGQAAHWVDDENQMSPYPSGNKVLTEELPHVIETRDWWIAQL
jgi:hypothetical protein